MVTLHWRNLQSSVNSTKLCPYCELLHSDDSSPTPHGPSLIMRRQIHTKGCSANISPSKPSRSPKAREDTATATDRKRLGGVTTESRMHSLDPEHRPEWTPADAHRKPRVTLMLKHQSSPLGSGTTDTGEPRGKLTGACVRILCTAFVTFFLRT